MATYERKDRFYKQAKEEGHLSRAFYKLEQIQTKFKIIKKGDTVIDLGCAPGGWLEIASKLVGQSGRVVGIDILPVKIKNLPNVKVILGDINETKTDQLLSYGKKADVVISDMAPSTSGVKFRDSYLSYELASAALQMAEMILVTGGNFAVKIFPGEEFASYKKGLESHFEKVFQYRPEATRKSSNEIYLVAIGFKKGI